MKILRTCFLLSSLFINSVLVSQTTNPYFINGNAYQENCNCYTLTPDINTQSGSLWNINKIDLNQSFDYSFNVNLGCTDALGADGIVFVLQPISVNIGASGGGLGYQGVSPSVGIAIDTWQNTDTNDPPYDHISIHTNGNINHSSTNNLAGPVTALANNDNIEDCQWHIFRIIWDASTKTLKASVDGVARVTATIDMITSVFGGDPNVFWGFTGSTGGSRNHQRVCTSLNPGFSLQDNLTTCYPDLISFKDTSTSFGSIVKWFWDLGDGTLDNSQNPPPHLYPAPGNYEVKLNILGNNGCLSDTFKRTVVVGSKPIAGFLYQPSPICDSTPVNFIDTSFVEFGTVNRWTWNINGTSYNTQNLVPIPITITSPRVATLQVQTKEGCISDPVTTSLNVLPRPKLAMSFADVCKGDSVFFTGTNTNASSTVQQWSWNFGNGNSDNSGPSVSQLYASAGKFSVQLSAIGDNGCRSGIVSSVVNIYETNAYAGNDTIVADNQPVQLKGSGGVLYSWSPATGLNDPTIANPIATVASDAVYVLTAYTPQGCSSTDTIKIKVFKGPAIYVPSAFSPNGDGRNDRFRIIAIGMKQVDYFRIYNRYGQLVYSASGAGAGWDGTFNGKAQTTGTFVWMVHGVDYNGQVYSKKGVVTLIR